MVLIGRRWILAGAVGAGTVAVATVAAATLGGKRAAPPVVILDPTPVSLSGMAALVRVTPVKAAPAIGFVDAGGHAKTLADYRGRGVVLNLWATWCGPCVAEMPSLVALARHAAANGFVVLPVSIDHNGATTVVPWLAKHGAADLPVLLDPDSAAAGMLGIRGVPTTFVIDPTGNIRGLLEGGADWSTDAALATVRELTA